MNTKQNTRLLATERGEPPRSGGEPNGGAVASHPVYTQPELLATRPNEVWSWDITKLKGPVKWTY